MAVIRKSAGHDVNLDYIGKSSTVDFAEMFL